MPPRALVSPTLALVATLALLAGCSSDPSGVAASAPSHASRSASSTPTASAGAKPYSPPTKAPAPLPVGSPDKTQAAIFVLVWFETLNYGYASGDADPLRNSIGMGCFTCANWIIEVQKQANDKLTRAGGYVHVRDLAYVGRVADDYTLRARLDRDPGVVTATDGTSKPVAQGSGEVVELRVGLSGSSLTGRKAWTMKSITSPTGRSGRAIRLRLAEAALHVVAGALVDRLVEHLRGQPLLHDHPRRVVLSQEERRPAGPPARIKQSLGLADVRASTPAR